MPAACPSLDWDPCEEIRRVIQTDSSGCGLACVAMVVGSTYLDVKHEAERIKVVPPGGPYGTRVRDVVRLLDWYGYQNKPRNNRFTWKKFDGVFIVGVNDSAPHWVVVVRQEGSSYFYDPNLRIVRNKRTDFWRVQPIGLAVEIMGPKLI